MFPPATNTSKSNPIGCFLGVFLAFWCAITFGADILLVHDFLRQIRSMHYDRVDGTMLKCEILSESDADGGTSYSLDVAYTYVVDGQVYTGTQYRYGSTSFNLSNLRKVRAELAPGTPVAVYVRPGHPDDAILAPGIIGYDLFGATMMIPFNVIAIGGLVVVALRNRPRFDPADRRIIAPTESGWRFHPYGRAWWAAFGTTVLVISFASIFVIGFGYGSNPPIAGMFGFWAAMLLLSATVGTRYRRWWALEYDRFRHTLTVRAEAVTVSVATIARVWVEEEVKTDSDGDKTTHYHVTLTWGLDDRMTRVAKFHDRPTAEVVTDWLAESLALKPPAA
jgi:hypothetical protein